MLSKSTIYRKSTGSITYTITQASVAFNLTGYTAYLTVKKNKTDADASALMQLTGVNDSPETLGTGTFTYSTSDSDFDAGEYWYDIYLSDGTNKFPVDVGRFAISEGITDTP